MVPYFFLVTEYIWRFSAVWPWVADVRRTLTGGSILIELNGEGLWVEVKDTENKT
jgi:hypothetical protein